MSFRSVSACLGAVVALTVATVIGAAAPAAAAPAPVHPSARTTAVTSTTAALHRSSATGPAVVTGLVVTTLSSTKAVLDWTVTRAGRSDSSLEVVRADGDTPITDPTEGTPIAELPVTATTWTDPALSPGATYTYGVFGLDADGTAGSLVSVTLTALTGDNTTGFAGIVRDGAGRPVPGIRVVTQDANGTGPSVTTGHDGTYRITGVAPGGWAACFIADDVSVKLEPTGLVTSCYKYAGELDGQLPPTFTVTAGAITPSISARLKAGAAFSGIVTDTSAHPLRGVVVEAYQVHSSGPRPVTAVTAVDGTYTIRGLATPRAGACFRTFGGPITGGSSSSGYVESCYDNQPIHSAHPQLFAISSGTVTTGIDAALAAGAAIQGRITSTSGEPAAGVGVLAEQTEDGGGSGSAVIGADGTYRIIGLVPGNYTVCSESGYAPEPTTGNGYLPGCYGAPVARQSPPTVITLANGQTRTNVSWRVRPAGGVTGLVTDSSGAPVAGVGVSAVQKGSGYAQSFTETAADGSYHLGQLPTGSYAVCFAADQTSAGVRSACYLNKPYHQFETRGTTSVAVTVGATTSGVNQVLQPEAPISGTVRDDNGTPIGYASIDVFTADQQNDVAFTQADASGSYTVHGLAPGTYKVCFQAFGDGSAAPYGYSGQCYDGHSDGSGDFDPVTAPATGIDASLSLAGAVSGTVTSDDGSPVSGAFVSVDDSTGAQLYAGDTDTTGAYEIDGVPSGTYKVCVDGTYADDPPPTGWDSVCTDLTVTVTAPALTSGIDIVLSAGAEISGTVTSMSTGQAPDFATVDVYTAQGEQQITSQFANGDGSYSVTGLAAGTYEVCFEDFTLESCYDATVGDPTQATPIPLVAGQVVTGIDGEVA